MKPPVDFRYVELVPAHWGEYWSLRVKGTSQLCWHSGDYQLMFDRATEINNAITRFVSEAAVDVPLIVQ